MRKISLGIAIALIATSAFAQQPSNGIPSGGNNTSVLPGGTTPISVPIVNGADGYANNSISGIANTLNGNAVPLWVVTSIFNGTTWDRARTIVGDAQAATGIAATGPVFFNGTTYDRARSIAGDAQASTGIAAAASIFFNGTTYDRARAVAGDAQAGTGMGAFVPMLWNGATYDRAKEGPATAATSRPVTIGPALLGSYCMAANTGTMAAGLGAGAPIYSFRYGGANLAIVRKVSMEADDITTAFAAGAAKVDLIAARSFSASDSGGTAATLTGNNGKLRTSFATTAISDLRISSTATLTAGTRTLDAQPLASVEFPVSTAIDAGLLPTTDLLRQNVGESPLVLANNEGFVIQATVPGTGTWVASVRTCWDEVSAF